MGSIHRITFQSAELIQLRANHSRVPQKVRGWGLAMDAIEIGTSYWIFGQPRSLFEIFYWLHTNLIRELEEGENYILFETASGSIYRVQYFEEARPEWVTNDLEDLMVEYATRSRDLFTDH